MTGAYLRVKRNNKYECVEIEYLTTEERKAIFLEDPTSPEIFFKWLDRTCHHLEAIAKLNIVYRPTTAIEYKINKKKKKKKGKL